MEHTCQTRCIDTGIDHYTHVPIPHKTLEQAETYAKDLTNRRICDVQILNAGGRIVDVFRDGASVLGHQATGRVS